MVPWEQRKQMPKDGREVPSLSQDGGQHSSLCGPEDKHRMAEKPCTLNHVAERENEGKQHSNWAYEVPELISPSNNNQCGIGTKQNHGRIIFVQNKSMLPGLWKKLPRCCSTDPPQQLELAERGSKLPAWCRGCGQQLELVKWVPPHLPKKRAGGSSNEGIVKFSKAWGEQKSFCLVPPQLLKLWLGDLPKTTPLGAQREQMSLPHVRSLFLETPHLLLHMNQGKIFQFCF